MNLQAYERITDRIIALLKEGTIPWRKPWKARTGWPRNIVSKSPYRGINVFLLLSMSYESPFWLTFRQATVLGGTVRKGEKACPVVFWKRIPVEDKESGGKHEIPILRMYHVFNASQCDGIGEAPVPEQPTEMATGQVGKPDEIVANMPKRPVIKHGMTQSFYSPVEDCVGMPLRERFAREEEYFSALFHELIHATGHKTRLDRPNLSENAGFGSDPYSKEELIAEMGAAFLSGHAEIIDQTIDNSAAYLTGWLKRLEKEHTLIVQAAAQAQKATDFILGRFPAEVMPDENQNTVPCHPEVAA